MRTSIDTMVQVGFKFHCLFFYIMVHNIIHADTVYYYYSPSMWPCTVSLTAKKYALIPDSVYTLWYYSGDKLYINCRLLINSESYLCRIRCLKVH